jgi:hypothetical protein
MKEVPRNQTEDRGEGRVRGRGGDVETREKGAGEEDR